MPAGFPIWAKRGDTERGEAESATNPIEEPAQAKPQQNTCGRRKTAMLRSRGRHPSLLWHPQLWARPCVPCPTPPWVCVAPGRNHGVTIVSAGSPPKRLQRLHAPSSRQAASPAPDSKPWEITEINIGADCRLHGWGRLDARRDHALATPADRCRQLRPRRKMPGLKTSLQSFAPDAPRPAGLTRYCCQTRTLHRSRALTRQAGA